MSAFLINLSQVNILYSLHTFYVVNMRNSKIPISSSTFPYNLLLLLNQFQKHREILRNICLQFLAWSKFRNVPSVKAVWKF